MMKSYAGVHPTEFGVKTGTSGKIAGKDGHWGRVNCERDDQHQGLMNVLCYVKIGDN